jgi:hypothetical protein
MAPASAGMKPLLFVSHSSRDTDLAMRIADWIRRRSACLPIIDLLDLEQGTGGGGSCISGWRPRRAGTSHRRGDRSNWGLQEARILRARNALEPGFRVLLVMPGLRTIDADAIADTARVATSRMADATGRSRTTFALSRVTHLRDTFRDMPHTTKRLWARVARCVTHCNAPFLSTISCMAKT